MTDSPKKDASGARAAEKKPATAVAQRRASARRMSEEARQVQIVLVTGGAIGLAFLIVLIGVIYDQAWVPSRPIAQVGSTSLSRGDYWTERRLAFAREVTQNFQLLALFGANSQFSQQFQGRSPVINQQIEQIRSLPIDDAVVDDWMSRQIKAAGAQGLNLSVTDDEAIQQLVSDLRPIFLPEPVTPVTPTTTVSETATLSETEVLSATEPTAEPTPTLQPTPSAAQANTDLPAVIDAIYRQYEIELISVEFEPILTKDEFRKALIDQYREQVLNRKIQEQLVPYASFVLDETPNRVRARQVLIAVTPPVDADQAAIDALFAEAKTEADAVAKELQGGAEFATVAIESSDDLGSIEQAGDLGFFDDKGAAENGSTYAPELVAEAFKLAPNTISAPIRTQFGWHIIEVTDRDIPDRETQLREARTEALDTWVTEQRTAQGATRIPAPTVTPTLEATPEPTPTFEPIYQPGPPTQVPTPTAAPTVEAPTPTATTTP